MVFLCVFLETNSKSGFQAWLTLLLLESDATSAVETYGGPTWLHNPLARCTVDVEFLSQTIFGIFFKVI